MAKKSIKKMTFEEIIQLQPKDITGGMATHVTRHIFEALEAFWMHDGDMSKPHVLLTSGNHSNGYINCKEVFQHPNLRMIFAIQMVKMFKSKHCDVKIGKNDWVIGSDTAATDLAGDIAKVLGCRHGVLRKGPDKEQIWLGERIEGEVVQRLIQEGEKVLHIEELMTTAITAERVRAGVGEAHSHPVEYLPSIVVLMHRSEVYKVENADVLPVNHFDIENWDPEKYCLYCENNSPLVENPKENWALLTGQKI